MVSFFWLVFLFFGIAVPLFSRYYIAEKHVDKRPELKKGYVTLFRAQVLIFTIPVLLIRISFLTGSVKDLGEYFNPLGLNPFVVTLYFLIISLWFMLARWIFFKNGASFLSKHPAMTKKAWILNRPDTINEKAIKFSGGIFLIALAMWICIAWSGILR